MAELLTIEQAAEFLGLTKAEVYRLIGAGELDAVIEVNDDPDVTGPSGALAHLRLESSVVSAYRQTMDQP